MRFSTRSALLHLPSHCTEQPVHKVILRFVKVLNGKYALPSLFCSMSIKTAGAKLFATLVYKKLRREALEGVAHQQKTLAQLASAAEKTAFGQDHRFTDVRTPQQFAQAVPVRDYEGLKTYIERVKHGERDVLWPGLPLYFCKTSGTTSGTKYIPLTTASMPNHIGSARNALLSYIAETGNASFVDGKMIFLQGSPLLEHLPSGIPFGRLSGIVANHVPAYLQKNRMPSFDTNCIEDWETKVRAIASETSSQNMSLISGIPSWVQMYFEVLLATTGKKTIAELFPNFNLFVFGGVNFEPYRQRFESLIGRKTPTIELYPASEGFIAFQDSQNEPGLLLNTNSGIYFEFIPADEYYQENKRRLSLAEVQIGVNYALVLSNNAGLWGYSIGDTVKFVSLAPWRIVVTGRIAHFTSAFGEHVIAEEVERAMSAALRIVNAQVNEFHLSPQVQPKEGLPYHEWVIEWEHKPQSMDAFAVELDRQMAQQNIYYRDLLQGKVLRPLRITSVKKGAFNEYMKSIGKLGGQNKIPRLSNDRKIADALAQFELSTAS